MRRPIEMPVQQTARTDNSACVFFSGAPPPNPGNYGTIPEARIATRPQRLHFLSDLEGSKGSPITIIYERKATGRSLPLSPIIK